jgi:F-type H+-transporting ATPase subunit delta
MASITAAKRYAKGLLQVGVETKHLDRILADMLFIKSAMDSEPMLDKVLNSPIVNDSKKKAIVTELVTGTVSETTVRLVDILAEKQRFGLLKRISSSFETLYNAHAGILEIKIMTAFDLDKTQLDKIVKAISISTGKTIKHTVQVDKNLIGGLAIKYGDTVIDGSVRNKLEQLTGLLHVNAV